MSASFSGFESQRMQLDGGEPGPEVRNSSKSLKVQTIIHLIAQILMSQPHNGLGFVLK